MSSPVNSEVLALLFELIKQVDDHLELGRPLPAPAPAPVEPAFLLPVGVPVNNPDDINLELSLAPPAGAPDPLRNNQWDITKTLTDSDVGNHSRLLIPKEKVIRHILRALSDDDRKQVQTADGLRIKVLDVDRNREVILTLKVLPSSHAHILNGEWKAEFVNVLGLARGDVVGLRYWKQPGDLEGKLLFKVLRPPERQ